MAQKHEYKRQTDVFDHFLNSSNKFKNMDDKTLWITIFYLIIAQI